ncbi:hypothetical protein TREMEDRAFT_74231 [Tremella mesenterica DSM 1558]|uniref:uncharacterized protein n=1 Tax=Tremella mesenterica (strain ATCC 24925 / CBS 8224 / DSM 1558 / NBRC 9311 / NRRL Y-6157 / RJB 2259-6 / UBC 559-6) TaxID=578456 RepID=UPI0003F4A5F5|nr:uncharacterized protein TREMEDRAFT_74231 [Tremella mesenterica DSM 1558]EIW68295.1 hypothetical protein TREMEDRAFT_74231 [Tremella mesenterica DSM 1558]
MPLKETIHKYPLIDADPHARRVVRYMRPSDYAVWAGATVAGPAALYLFEKVDPTRSKFGITPALRLTGFLGFCAGFMLAYQNSSKRFWGWSENAIEVTKDQKELSTRLSDGKPLYGETDLSDYLQGVAARNSTWSQLKFQAIPWFNTVNHNQHGVDTSKYGTQQTPP